METAHRTAAWHVAKGAAPGASFLFALISSNLTLTIVCCFRFSLPFRMNIILLELNMLQSCLFLRNMRKYFYFQILFISSSIILMHDGGGNRTETVQALPIIMQTLLQGGFKLVTVNQLINDTHNLVTVKSTNSSPVATIGDQPEAWADALFTRRKLA